MIFDCFIIKKNNLQLTLLMQGLIFWHKTISGDQLYPHLDHLFWSSLFIMQTQPVSQTHSNDSLSCSLQSNNKRCVQWKRTKKELAEKQWHQLEDSHPCIAEIVQNILKYRIYGKITSQFLLVYWITYM